MMGAESDDAARRAVQNNAAFAELEGRIIDIDRRILMKAEDHASDIMALWDERGELRAQQAAIMQRAIRAAKGKVTS
jgi:hypothetical protein